MEAEAIYLQAKQFVIKCFAHFSLLFQTYIPSLITLHPNFLSCFNYFFFFPLHCLVNRAAYHSRLHNQLHTSSRTAQHNYNKCITESLSSHNIKVWKNYQLINIADKKIYCKLINHEIISSFKTNTINSSHTILYHQVVTQKKNADVIQISRKMSEVSALFFKEWSGYHEFISIHRQNSRVLNFLRLCNNVVFQKKLHLIRCSRSYSIADKWVYCKI